MHTAHYCKYLFLYIWTCRTNVEVEPHRSSQRCRRDINNQLELLGTSIVISVQEVCCHNTTADSSTSLRGRLLQWFLLFTENFFVSCLTWTFCILCYWYWMFYLVARSAFSWPYSTNIIINSHLTLLRLIHDEPNPTGGWANYPRIRCYFRERK